MINTILTALYYAAPGMIANAMPIIFRKTLKFLAMPADFGKTIRSKRILGNNKTIRGFVVGIIIAIVLVYCQKLLCNVKFFNSISYVNYSSFGFSKIILVGFILGFGALLGDSVKSFFKRRANIKPGGKFFPWDQVDYIIGIIILTLFIKPMTIGMIIALVVLGILLSIIFTKIGHLLKIKKTNW